jgi:hypothetical protein
MARAKTVTPKAPSKPIVVNVVIDGVLNQGATDKTPKGVPAVNVKKIAAVPVGKSKADNNQVIGLSPGGTTQNNARAAARGIRPTLKGNKK